MAKGTFEFFQLRCFVAVARELNFRRAAVQLNMTQPPLSRQIKLLEHGLGVTLLERNQSGVRLTRAGDSFLASASELLQKAEAAVLFAQQAERGVLGSVTLGFVPSAGIKFVPEMIVKLAQEMPNVTFNTMEMMGYEIEDGLVSGRLDFGINRVKSKVSGVECHLLVNEPFVLAIPATHPLASLDNPKLKDLDDVAMIGYASDRGGIVRKAHAAAFSAANVSPRIVRETSHTHTVLAMVNSGLGVSLVPHSAQTMQMTNIVFRPIELPPICRSTMYLNISPHQREQLHMRVAEVLMRTLDVPDSV